MLAGTLAFAAGIFLFLQSQSLPELTYSLFGPICLVLGWRYRNIRVPMCFMLGFLWTLFYSHIFINKLPLSIENKTLTVEGRVVSLPEMTNRYQRFLFEISNVNQKEVNRITIRLNWYQTTRIIKPGQHWRFNVKLKRPYGFQNPNGFDYELWLLRQGISATGYVKNNSDNKFLQNDDRVWLQRLRYYLSSNIKSIATERQGLLLALAIGDRSELTNDERERLNVTGTTHLIAISGLHLGLVATFVFFLARILWSRSYFLTNRLSAPLFASLAAFSIAAIYAAIAGFSLPTQRALIMIACVLVSISAYRPITLTNSLSCAALVILLLDPFAILFGDFWLSFIAVAVIIYLTKNRQFPITSLVSWLYLQIGLFVFLMPFLIAIFNRLLLYNIAANLVAIPLIGMLVVPGILIAICLLPINLFAAEIIIIALEKLLNWVWHWLGMIQEISFNNFILSEPTLWAIVTSTLGIILLFMPRGLPCKWLGLILILPLFFPIDSFLQKGDFDFILLDVGQGLAGLVSTQHHHLLFDTGAKFSEQFDIGSAVIIPYLRSQGISNLDMMIVSHGDNDHIGGAQSIINHINIKSVLSSVPEELAYANAKNCLAGQQWEWDGVSFMMLHPGNSDQLSNNDQSCVLKISGANGSLLLTGDIEQQAEQLIIKRYSSKLAADVLVAPHHGSKTSSSMPFLEEIKAKYSLISAGYRNRFGLPNQDILTRYEQRGIETLTTFQSGAISLQFRQSGLRLQQTRTEQRRFWHNTATNN
ncbi:MAG: DNA internalization-related competence protein ComEC/Rec2 [Pseudomonadota bacterium]